MTERTDEARTEETAHEDCRRSLRRLRLQNGMAVLFTAMGSMIAMVVLDTVLSQGGAEGTLAANAFEAFKLIAVTVLGYIFGANQTKPGGE